MNKHSGLAREAVNSGKAGRMVAAYMVLSYAYYRRDVPVSLVSDHDYDELCKTLNQDDVWTAAQAHQHARYISRADLAAGTGFKVKAYPNLVVHSAENLVNEAGL